MHKFHFIARAVALGALVAVCSSSTEAGAADLNTGDFVAACGENVGSLEDPSFEEANVTPKAFCECVAEELAKGKVSQTDVDMLTKMHKEGFTDEDVETYPTLEELMNANEGFEDACRERLGLPTNLEPEFDDGIEEGMPEEEEVPMEDDGSPPE